MDTLNYSIYYQTILYYFLNILLSMITKIYFIIIDDYCLYYEWNIFVWVINYNIVDIIVGNGVVVIIFVMIVGVIS